MKKSLLLAPALAFVFFGCTSKETVKPTINTRFGVIVPSEQEIVVVNNFSLSSLLASKEKSLISGRKQIVMQIETYLNNFEEKYVKETKEALLNDKFLTIKKEIVNELFNQIKADKEINDTAKSVITYNALYKLSTKEVDALLVKKIESKSSDFQKVILSSTFKEIKK